MGTRNVKILKLLVSLTHLLLLNHYCLSQTTIHGSVRDHSENLYAASIVLKDSLSKKIIDYTYSNSNGNYELKIDKFGRFNLIFTSLGYELKTIPLVLNPDQKELKIEVVLTEKPMSLDEVVIKAESPIIFKEDTYLYFPLGLTTNSYTMKTINFLPGSNYQS